MTTARLGAFVVVLNLWSCGPDSTATAGIDDDITSDPTQAVDEALAAGTVAVGAAADAMVRSGTSANTRFGTRTTLRTDGDATGDIIRSYLRFSVPRGTGPLKRAVLRCFVTNGSAASYDVLAARSDWSESTVTYNTQPARIGTSLGTPATAKANAYAEVDVTSAVTPGSDVSFALMPRSADGVTCNSREAAANRPSLVLTFAPPLVAVVQPAAGSTVSGTLVLAALINGTASATDAARVDFVVDSVTYGPAVILLGFDVTLDTTKLANGTHQVFAKATDAAGNVTSSPTVSFNVANATETWADHLGISMSGALKNLQMAKALGVRWVRFGWEMGWGPYDYSEVANAHALGLKVLWVCQKGAGSNGHAYTDGDVAAFASYCAAAADHGVDAIEIGNEWNHAPFYMYNGVGPDPTFVSQAKFMDATTAAIRAKSATLPLMNSGWSPEGSPLSPPEAMATLLDRSTTFKQKGTLIAHHPYAYNCDTPLGCDFEHHPEWNAFLQTAKVYANAKARGYDHPVWMTEIGGPSGNGTNPWTKTPYTLQSQAQLYKDYLTGVGVLRGQGVKMGVLFFHGIQDGQSSTSFVEDTFGVYDKNWALKPAGQVLKDRVPLPW